MGGHVALLGMQEFPARVAAGLAICTAGPGEMDFLVAVHAASEAISGMAVNDGTREADLARLAVVYGTPPANTGKGRQLASVQIETSGGARPFALRVSPPVSSKTCRPVRESGATRMGRVATNAHVAYAIDETLGLTVNAINTRVRRRAVDSAARVERRTTR
jgi:hypothetical protein